MSSIEAKVAVEEKPIRDSEVSKLVIERIKRLYLEIDDFKQKLVDSCSDHCINVMDNFSKLMDEHDKAEAAQKTQPEVETLLPEIGSDLKCVAEIDLGTNIVTKSPWNIQEDIIPVFLQIYL